MSRRVTFTGPVGLRRLGRGFLLTDHRFEIHALAVDPAVKNEADGLISC